MYSIEQRDTDLINSTAAIRYHFYFDRAHQHILRVRMEIDDCHDTTTLTLPVWIPGSYKVREYSSNITLNRIVTADGILLQHTWINKHSFTFTLEQSTTVAIEYTVWCYERDSTIRSSHITRNHAFINPVTACWYVESRMNEIHHVILHLDATNWQKTSTALSPVYPPITDTERTITLGALNYDIIVDSPLEIGNHYTHSFIHREAQIDVAIAGRGNYNADWITEQIKILVSKEAEMFGGLPFDRYVFILHLFPNMRNGGLEHARSSVNAAEHNALSDQTKTWRLLSLLVHEFFHVWNVKRIRPKQLGPFDYTRENYTDMLWLVEGATSYYDDLISYRCGFYSRDEYLKILATDHLTPLLHTPGRLHTSLSDSSYLAWVKLYFPTEDLQNRVPSYYLKGGVIFLLTDLILIAKTQGKKKFDHVFKALWKRYQNKPAVGITSKEFFSIARREMQVDVLDIMQPWLETTQDITVDDLKVIFAPFGITVSLANSEPSNKQQFSPRHLLKYYGFSVKEDNARFLISFVEDNSPADQAGFGVDDEILTLDGKRPLSIEEVGWLLSNTNKELTSVTLSSDTTLITTTLQPRLSQDIVLSVNSNLTKDQLRLLKCWLQA